MINGIMINYYELLYVNMNNYEIWQQIEIVIQILTALHMKLKLKMLMPILVRIKKCLILVIILVRQNIMMIFKPISCW